jgi:hypothetical protein
MDNKPGRTHEMPSGARVGMHQRSQAYHGNVSGHEAPDHWPSVIAKWTKRHDRLPFCFWRDSM